MSQATSPNTRNSSGSVTPRRRSDEFAPTDEFATLAATTPILLRLPDLHPSENGATRSEPVASLPPHAADPMASDTEVTTSAAPASATQSAAANPLLSDDQNSWGESPDDSDAANGKSSPPITATWETISGAESTIGQQESSPPTSSPETLRIPVSELRVPVASSVPQVPTTDAGAAAGVEPSSTNSDESLIESSVESTVESTVDAKGLPWESNSEVVVGNWTELGGKLFVGLLSTLLVVVLAMDPVASDGDVEKTETAPGGLRMLPSSSDINSDPYVTTASGQMPADPMDGPADTFTIRPLRPSVATPTSTPSNADDSNVRVGQPTEQFNDTIYR
jgi:hypothetical protein